MPIGLNTRESENGRTLVRHALQPVAMASAALLLGTLGAQAETPDSMCGSKPEMVGIMLRMAEDGVEKLYSDNKMFVKRDGRDGSLWVVTLPNTTAHPAVVCRTAAKEISMLCAAGEKACASFKGQAAERLDKIEATAR
jgi:hypothetical protein